mmetsp:Transcript_14671/g.27578  ORF Transcript_14671/g.27578 Transcript_14671/m.27578 type:complete len:204 (-) Transcript_14671:86-697(-)
MASARALTAMLRASQELRRRQDCENSGVNRRVALDYACDCKRPRCSALTLILGWGHHALMSPIEVLGEVCCRSTHIEWLLFEDGGLTLLLAKASQTPELRRKPVRELVDCQPVGGSGVCIVGLDLLPFCIKGLLPLGILGRIRDVLLPEALQVLLEHVAGALGHRRCRVGRLKPRMQHEGTLLLLFPAACARAGAKVLSRGAV